MGLLVGGLIGVIAVVVLQSDDFWVALLTAALGAIAGYWNERRKRDTKPD